MFVITSYSIHYTKLYDQLSEKRKAHYTGVSLKTGLIIFLENLLAYLLLSESKQQTKITKSEVDLGGLLGITKAEKNLNNTGLDRVIISVDQEDTILVRQISLGINGRYRTPFIEAGLIDTS